MLKQTWKQVRGIQLNFVALKKKEPWHTNIPQKILSTGLKHTHPGEVMQIASAANCGGGIERQQF